MLDSYLLEARERCLKNRLDPNVLPSFVSIAQEDLGKIQMDYKKILDITRLFMNKFLENCQGIPLLVGITDDKANIIEYLGDPSIEDTVVNQLGLSKGVCFAEEQAGINSIAAAINLAMPVQIIGEGHFHDFLKETACYSAPLFHQNKVIGTISLMTFIHVANPLIMASLVTVVDSIQREMDLLEKNRYLDELNHMMLEQSTTGYIVIDSNGTIVKINPKAESFLGVLQCQTCTSIKEISQLSQVYTSYIEGKSVQDFKIVFQNETDTLTCLVDFFPFQEGTIIQLHDITEYIKTEAYIQNAEKLTIVGQLAAGVAHEIKNPLTTLKGFIQLRAGESGTFPEIMLNEINRIDQITNEFLVLSRPTIQEKDWHNLCDLISEIGVLLSSFAITKNVEIIYDFQETMPIYCDGNQLKQVFINLVKNSVEAMGQNGKLIISVKSMEDDQLLIRFKDDGIGFSNQIRKRLGQPFLTTKKSGNGLGLMVCKRIVETIHNGEIQIGNAKNGGAVVDIILPREAL